MQVWRDNDCKEVWEWWEWWGSECVQSEEYNYTGEQGKETRDRERESEKGGKKKNPNIRRTRMGGKEQGYGGKMVEEVRKERSVTGK